MRGKYFLPSDYPIAQRIRIIAGHLDEGMSFHDIAVLFDVQEPTIRYHWDRYHLKSKKRPYKKPRDVYKEYLVELHKAGLL